MSPVRHRVYEILELGRSDDLVSRRVDNFLIALIVLNALSFTAETVPEIDARYGAWLHAFDAVSAFIFTVEYVLRLWSCVEMPFLRRLPSWRARLIFAQRPFLLIDLLAILPFYLSFFLAVDLRILRLLRLLRFLKLARYSPALHALTQVFIHESKALAGAFLLMMMMLLFAATGMYLLERHAQPDAFGTIPDAAWWAMATLTTIGYGDVTPITPFGKVFGALVMIVGLGMFALPLAIIGAGFAQELRRRDFVVTWPMLARIPLLADLEPRDAIDLMPHLRAQDFPPHWDVISPGDEAESMYFIASGQLRVRDRELETLLGPGDFFGEASMLSGGRHKFAFTTASRVRVLQLHRSDFHRFENAHPETAERIRRVAESHSRARDAVTDGEEETPT